MRAVSRIFGSTLLVLILSGGSLAAQTDDAARVFRSIEVTGNDRFRDRDVLAIDTLEETDFLIEPHG